MKLVNKSRVRKRKYFSYFLFKFKIKKLQMIYETGSKQIKILQTQNIFIVNFENENKKVTSVTNQVE